MKEQPGLRPNSPAESKRELLTRLLADRARNGGAAEDPTALSFAQQRLWFAEQLAPGTWAYHIPMALRLRGALDPGALEGALTGIVKRHETLRTSFPIAGEGPSARVAQAVPITLTPIDLSIARDGEAELQFRALWKEEIRTPFNLSQGPLMRARLVRIAPLDHVLLVTMHHIVCDGLSLSLFLRELAASYEALASGRQPQLPPLSGRYVDLAESERRRVAGGLLDEELHYWVERLAGAVPLELPADRRRPAHPSHQGGIEQRVISAPLLSELRAVGQRARASLFMTLLAAFKATLARYAGQDDVAVGSPVSGRTRPEAEGLIGCFVNTVVFRTDLSGDPTFAELLGRVRETTLGAYDRRELPFERLVEKLQLQRDLSRAPLVQVFFNMISLAGAPGSLHGLELEMLDAEEEGAKFDLTLYAIERPHDLLLRLVYATDLFDRQTIAELLRRFELLLSAIAERSGRRLSELPLMSEDEQSELVGAFNAPLA